MIKNDLGNDYKIIVSTMLLIDILGQEIVVLAGAHKESVHSLRLGLRIQQGRINAKGHKAKYYSAEWFEHLQYRGASFIK